MEKSKRVILVQGEGVWYEQAIFIVKNGMDAGSIPKDFVLEAERIVENYLNPKAKTAMPLVFSEGVITDSIKLPLAKTAPKKKSKSFDVLLNVAMILCVCVLAVMINLFVFNK